VSRLREEKEKETEKKRERYARACMRFSPRRSIRLAHRNVSFPRSLARMERHQFSTVYRSRHGKVPVTRLPGGTLSVLLPPSLSFPLSAPYAVGEASMTRTRAHRHTTNDGRHGEE